MERVISAIVFSLLLVGILSTHKVAIAAASADIAIADIQPWKRIVGQCFPVRINVTLQNQGDEEAVFNVTLRANMSRIGEITNMKLANGTSKTVTVTWNTRSVSKRGNYTISANATILVGETDVDDNTFVDGWVFVTIAGDVDGNRRIDIFDIVRLAMVYGVSLPNPRYDPYCDIDDNGMINIFDIVIAEYGMHW